MQLIWNELVSLANKYQLAIAIALGIAILVVVATNIALSPYRKHNKAVSKSISSLRISSRVGRMGRFVSSIPSCYLPQWHCYTLSSVSAVDMFTPIASTNKRRMVSLYLVAHLIMIALLVTVDLTAVTATMFATYIALILPSIWLVKSTNKAHYMRALKLFDRYVSLIDAYFDSSDRVVAKVAQNSQVDNLVSQITLLADSKDQDKYSKISKVLAMQPLCERTPSQQRRINHALNAVAVPPPEQYEQQPSMA